MSALSRWLAPALALAAAIAPAAALCQTRPLQTEEATTAPAGRIALEAGVRMIDAQPNFVGGLARARWDVPVLNLVYSPAANVELDVEWVGGVIAADDPAFGTVSDFGDVTLRSKLRLFAESGSRPAFGARFCATLPVTDSEKGLGPNTNRLSVQLLLTKSVGPARLHLNAGVAIHDEVSDPAVQDDLLAYGFAAEVRLGRRTLLLGEVAGRGGEGEPSVDRTHEARLGARLGAGSVQWDLAVRRGLSDADGDWGFTAGLTWTLRPGRP